MTNYTCEISQGRTSEFTLSDHQLSLKVTQQDTVLQETSLPLSNLTHLRVDRPEKKKYLTTLEFSDGVSLKISNRSPSRNGSCDQQQQNKAYSEFLEALHKQLAETDGAQGVSFISGNHRNVLLAWGLTSLMVVGMVFFASIGFVHVGGFSTLILGLIILWTTVVGDAQWPQNYQPDEIPKDYLPASA